MSNGEKEKVLKRLSMDEFAIENAPKDGRYMLLYDRYEKEPYLGYWSLNKNKWCFDIRDIVINGDATYDNEIDESYLYAFRPLPERPEFPNLNNGS